MWKNVLKNCLTRGDSAMNVCMNCKYVSMYCMYLYTVGLYTVCTVQYIEYFVMHEDKYTLPLADTEFP